MKVEVVIYDIPTSAKATEWVYSYNPGAHTGGRPRKKQKMLLEIMNPQEITACNQQYTATKLCSLSMEANMSPKEFQHYASTLLMWSCYITTTTNNSPE